VDPTSGVFALAAVAMANAGETRTMVRSMGVVTMPGLTEVATMHSREELLAMAMTLAAADERLDGERMSPLDHEALWWHVYEKLAPAAAVASVRKMPQ
jgi:putative SOS response-associated peptidase YedK